MVRILAVADEVVPMLWTEQVQKHPVDVILAAGDLPFDYVEYLSATLDRPCVFVPGNHDPDLAGYRAKKGLWLRAGMPVQWPGPGGATNADGIVVDVAGLRIAGLGGSLRYRPGPNQWTERQQARRARRLARLATWRRRRDGKATDILLCHSPPLNCGDLPDQAHRGFACLHDAVRQIQPRLLLHGHVHRYGMDMPDRQLANTTVMNVVGYRILEFTKHEES